MAPAPSDVFRLTLQIVGEDVPPAERDDRAMEFGAQDKAGALYAGTTHGEQSLCFVLPLTARVGADRTTIDFVGPFVHGGPGSRFLYLGYRPLGETVWARRWKIPLNAITTEQARAAANSGRSLAGRISATSGSTAQLLGPGWTHSDIGDGEPT